MENDRKSSRTEVERYDLEILLRRPSLRSNIPRRVSQICREVSSEETKCGACCIRGQWLQSFANRNSFTLVYRILGSFYGSYYAYFYGVISTLEKRFGISSQTIGTIAATGDVFQVIMCFILSQFVPKTHRPKWIGAGVLFIVTSAVIFTLPHFLYESYEPKNMFIIRHSTYQKNGTSAGQCPEESESCAKNLEGRYNPMVLLILAQILHGIGGSLYFIVGKSYEDDNIEKYKPPALLSLLSVLKILGPAFGYWLSSISLKIFEHPTLTPDFSEEEPLWIGAWWLGSLIIGFILAVPGFFVIFFPTTLPKAAVKRIHNQLEGIPESGGNLEKTGEISILKKLLINPTIKCTHFAAIFNSLGFIAYFIFLPKYVETQFRISASNANLIAAEGVTQEGFVAICHPFIFFRNLYTSSVALISAAVGIVTANSIITRYRPSARALASWTVIVGILSAGGLTSYIFLDCQANDYKTKIMTTQHLDNTCKCINSSFFPACDEFNQPFISLCHAGCESTLHINTQDYEICNQTKLPSNARKVFKGFCNVDCHSTFLKFIIVTCSLTFIYATGRTSMYWFETQSEEKEEKSTVSKFGMLIGFIASIPAPIIFGHLLDESCLLWEGNCKGSGNCWLYNNEKMRFNMNLTAIGFAIISILFDVGVWYSVKNLKLFDGIEYYVDEIDEI